MTAPLVTVAIDNYNYDAYIAAAIESALGQTYPHVEVVVVDDGSTDASREIISRYADRVKAVLKQNEGMVSATNAGFEASTGDVIIFLNADDLLAPTALERIAPLFASEALVKAHWPLRVIDAEGNESGGTVPASDLPSGELRKQVIAQGPACCPYPPMSGNAWSRRLLERTLPVPPEGLDPDSYLAALAPVYGTIGAVNDPLGFYRVHGTNMYASLSLAERLRWNLKVHSKRVQHLVRHLAATGVSLEEAPWMGGSDASTRWVRKLLAAFDQIQEVVPPGNGFILVDEHHLSVRNDEEILDHRPHTRFIEKSGEYVGRPESDIEAIEELERLRSSGWEALVFAWPSFWWLEHYADFRRHLDARYRLARASDLIIAYDLAREPEPQRQRQAARAR